MKLVRFIFFSSLVTWVASQFISVNAQLPFAGVNMYKWGWVFNQGVGESQFDIDVSSESLYSAVPTYRTVPLYSPSRPPKIFGVFGPFIFIPHWLVIAPTGLLIFFFPRRIVFNNEGNCDNCDYNLEGNESGVCPECGDKIE